MKIPYQNLSPEALQGLIEEFIAREGTDYGDIEINFETKVKQLMSQLKLGTIEIAYDSETQSCTLITKP